VADNTLLNPGPGLAAGDSVRDIDRTLNSVPGAAKTQVTQLDAGGQAQEQLVSRDNPLPVVPVGGGLVAIQHLAQQNLAFMQANPPNGYVPAEALPFFFGGF
jgi:hypothetical protein